VTELHETRPEEEEEHPYHNMLIDLYERIEAVRVSIRELD
jgi:hypothetical protein